MHWLAFPVRLRPHGSKTDQPIHLPLPHGNICNALLNTKVARIPASRSFTMVQLKYHKEERGGGMEWNGRPGNGRLSSKGVGMEWKE